MNAASIFLDLDGTLLDVSERYHRLHSDQVERHGGRPVPLPAYWEARRQPLPEAGILRRTGLAQGDIAAVQAAQRRLIESPRYLRYDRAWPWTANVLEQLGKLGPLVLVTLRRHRDRLETQLTQLSIRHHFAAVVAAAGNGRPAAKAELLRDAGLPLGQGVLIGDTEVDIAAGRALGMLTIAVHCGIRSAPALAACQPDLLLADLRDVPAVLVARRLRQDMDGSDTDGSDTSVKGAVPGRMPAPPHQATGPEGRR